MRLPTFTPAVRAALLAALTVMTIITPASAHLELVVGRNAAGQLTVSADYPSPWVMPRYIYPAVPGWASADLCWSSITTSFPADDIYTLPTGSFIQFILVSADEQMKVFNDIGTDHMQVGEAFYLGSPYFMTHPLWHIPVGPVWQERTMQVRLHDLSGQSADSAIIELHFTAGCRGDVNRSGEINVQDLLAVIGGWGPCPPGCHSPCPGDITGSCVVNVDDLLVVIGAWGRCG